MATVLKKGDGGGGNCFWNLLRHHTCSIKRALLLGCSIFFSLSILFIFRRGQASRLAPMTNKQINMTVRPVHGT